MFFIAQPQDLSDIGGYGPAAKKTSARDLKTVLQSALNRGYPVALTETELNQWLGQTLSAKQGGLLAGQVSLDRVWIRLEDGYAEVIMERAVMGRPFTVSMFLKIEQAQGARGIKTEIHRHGGPYHAYLPLPPRGGQMRWATIECAAPCPPRGGRFGKLVVPQGFLILVLPAYEKLAELYREEIRLAFEEMVRIRIEPNRLILDSREPAGDPSKLPQTF